LEEWLAKGDGDEEYTSEKMKDLISRRWINSSAK
jgi:hypothetical protein